MIDLEGIKSLVNARNGAVQCYDLFIEYKPMQDAFELVAFYRTANGKQHTSLVIPTAIFSNMTPAQTAEMVYLNRRRTS